MDKELEKELSNNEWVDHYDSDQEENTSEEQPQD